MARLPLTQGLFVEIDDGDEAWLKQFKWSADVKKHTTYAKRRDPTRKNAVLYMHRVILDAPAGVDVDHIDRDGLNNRRPNLRLATRAENLWNSRLATEGGVYWHKSKALWRARIKQNGREISVGEFQCKEDAQSARDYVAAVLRGGLIPEGFDTLRLPPKVRRLVIEARAK